MIGLRGDPVSDPNPSDVMTIQATCTRCGMRNSLANATDGKTQQCRGCGSPFTVPENSRAGRTAQEATPQAGRVGLMTVWLIGCGAAAALGLLTLIGGGIVLAVVFWPANTPGPTAAQFDRIRAGMSEKEVVALLGPPHADVNLPPVLAHVAPIGVDPARTKDLAWRGASNATFRVVLVDGFVAGALGTDGKNVYAPVVANAAGPGGPNPGPAAGGPPAAREAMEANFRKLRLGMTKAELIAILGQPMATLDVSGELIFQNTVGDSIVVVVRDDKVVKADARINGEPIPLEAGDLPPAAAKATADGFRKVRRDMTERQVVALLGPPDKTDVNGGRDLGVGFTPTVKFLSWGAEPGDVFHLTLQNGRVTTGNARINGRVVAMSPDDQGGNAEGRPMPKPDLGGKPLDPAVVDAFNKAKVGMSEAEVVELLGKPAFRQGFPARDFGGEKFPSRYTLFWRGAGQDHITIQLVDDKVVSGTSSVNGKTVSVGGRPNPN
jgi:outer membrane protein assembly factor BamE (lipoprotein component of BamABCDE complex)